MVRRRNGAFTQVDLLVAVIVVLLLAGFAVSAVRALTEADLRKQCAANLRQIGQAVLLYANENKNAFPRTTFDGRKDPPVPTWGTPYEGNKNLAVPVQRVDPFAAVDGPDADYRPKGNDVTAALFLLMRTQEITSVSFVCPATGQAFFKFGGGNGNALNFTNWPGTEAIRESLSYSFANPYGSKAAMAKGFKFANALSPAFAIAADMNPGGEGLTRLTAASPAAELRKGNSPNHRADGQNVLYADGHVDYAQSPFVGSQRDNVYTYGASGADKGGDGVVGAPVGPDDSVLLPTAVNVGIEDFPNRPKATDGKGPASGDL
jgi:prepilin-type processing-associated H-X9-DG protein